MAFERLGKVNDSVHEAALCKNMHKGTGVKETEKIKAKLPNVKKIMAELFLPFHCGIINRISLIFFTTCLMKYLQNTPVTTTALVWWKLPSLFRSC